MIVYRFEKDGLGPYVGGVRVLTGSFYSGRSTRRSHRKYTSLFGEASKKMSYLDRMDAWARAHQRKDLMYGCASKDLLRAYFRGNFKPLFKDGYRIKKYKVPDDEVIDIGVEVAFPVKYHKLQTLTAIHKKMNPV